MRKTINKTRWSVALLCITVAALLLMAALCLVTLQSVDNVQNAPTDPEGEALPGGAMLTALYAAIVISGGFAFWLFILSSAGFVASVINLKIATNGVIRWISVGFSVFYSAVILLVAGAVVYVLQAFV